MAKILLISNGHGEDLSGSILVQHLQQLDPTLTCAALPIVGAGNAYRRAHIPIISPTQDLPSGGFSYMSLKKLWQDITAGLVGLTWRQWQIARAYPCDLVVAIGDVVPLLFARAMGVPFVFYFVAMSAHYEGTTVIHPLAKLLMRSSQCRQIFTRDEFTAQDLRRRGYGSAQFVGNPFMSALVSSNLDLQLDQSRPMIALLPGSRLPEALANFALMLRLLPDLVTAVPHLQFRAALVPTIDRTALETIAQPLGWQLLDRANYYELVHRQTRVLAYSNAFSDILLQSSLVIGMAGTANEQAVGLGKPVVQLVGAGPQFTYRFAEAQKRLLGESVYTCRTLDSACDLIPRLLTDPQLPLLWQENARLRLGGQDGASKMAQAIYHLMSETLVENPPSS